MERTLSSLHLNNNVTKDIVDKISTKQDSHIATIEGRIEDLTNKLTKIEASSVDRESKLEGMILKLAHQVEYLVVRKQKEEEKGEKEDGEEKGEKEENVQWVIPNGFNK